MSIPTKSEKIKGLRGLWADDTLFVAILLIAVALLAFGLGRLSVGDAIEEKSQPSTISEQGVQEVKASNITITTSEESATELYVASKNSNKYHLPWCSGAQNISEKNKIWFNSKSEAEAAGYGPAGNCKGI